MLTYPKDARGDTITPVSWVVIGYNLPQTCDLAKPGTLWRRREDDPTTNVEGMTDPIWLDGLFLPVSARSVEVVDFYSNPDYYIGDVVLNLVDSADHPRGFYKVTGFRYSDCVYVVTDKDDVGRMPDRYRPVPQDVEDEDRQRPLWLAYDQACELVKMHPSAHPLHVEITALRHNLLDALLRLLEV